MEVKPNTKKESKEVYFLIIDKENKDFHNKGNKNSPKCIFTKKNDKGDNIKIFKYTVEKEKKENSVELEFINKDNEKFIVTFDIKESTFVYNLDFKKDRNFYKSKKIIEQNIENYEKMNYYIESLNESKEENKLNILFNDSINIYSKKPRFEFLVNIFIHVYNDENLCSKLLSEFDKNYTKEEQKNSIFPENLEKYLKNFNDICENIVNFNSLNPISFYGIIFCYLNNINKEKFIEMFKKLYEKDKKILFHILSKCKFYFKNQINMEINYLNELIDFSTSLQYEEFKENVIFYLRGINTFLKVIDNNKEKISIIDKFHPIEFPKIELESQANINEIIELINEIIEFSEEKKVLVVYFTNDFWDEMLKHCSSFNKDDIEKKRNNIEECFNLREKFVKYYKLVQLLYKNKKIKIKEDCVKYFEKDEYAFNLDKNIKCIIKEDETIENIEIINLIKYYDIYYSEDKYSNKRDIEIFEKINIEKIDDEFINEFKQMNFEKIFKTNIDKYLLKLCNKIKKIQDFDNILKLVDEKNLDEKHKKNYLDLLKDRYESIIQEKKNYYFQMKMKN